MKKHLLLLSALKPHHLNRIPACYEYRLKTPDSVNEEDIRWAEVIAGKVPLTYLPIAENLRLLQLETAGNEQYLNKLPSSCSLCNASGSFGLAISEYLICTILMLMRNIHLYQQHQKKHLWQVEEPISSIYGSKILVVGTGDLGKEFAGKVKMMGAHTIGINRHPKLPLTAFDELYGIEEIETLLPHADVVVLALPSTAKTRHIFQKQYYARMKENAILVNVGRGDALSLDELLEALHTYPIKGAVLDVMEQEPLPQQHPIWKETNVILTPHISGTFQLPESFERYVNILIQNLEAYAQGKALCNLVNIKEGH